MIKGIFFAVGVSTKVALLRSFLDFLFLPLASFYKGGASPKLFGFFISAVGECFHPQPTKVALLRSFLDFYFCRWRVFSPPTYKGGASPKLFGFFISAVLPLAGVFTPNLPITLFLRKFFQNRLVFP
ncbi:hypothetical protein [Runella slithyformis]|uniref:hypothetical protein n=1 Tax=Runella slithyformis TaxID=106 RepID=UPI00031D3521|nr:hypothetical protein [Runella slithyformis]